MAAAYRISYKGAEPTVKILARKYHVILVGYDGFNPSEPETEFVSVQYEARKLGDYIVEKYNGHIDILYGISYGGRVLMEVLSDNRLEIRDHFVQNSCVRLQEGQLTKQTEFYTAMLLGKAGRIRTTA